MRVHGTVVFAAALAVVAVVLSAPAALDALAARAGGDDAGGWLYLARFVPDHQKEEFKGFAEPRLFVFDDTGAAIPSDSSGGGHRPGELVAVPEGWYQVEVGDFPSKLNRWRYFVKKGKVTQVRSGLVLLPTARPSDQPSDPLCEAWRAELRASVWDDAGAMTLVASNSETPAEDLGMLQLHEGSYIFSFNHLFAVHEVRAGRTLALPTATIGPLAHSPYRISMRADDSVETPSIVLCKDRPTQILTGRYVGSYYIDTMSPPFRKRVWEEQTVKLDSGPEYKKAPKVPALRGKTSWRGEGSVPTRVVPVANADPLPKP